MNFREEVNNMEDRKKELLEILKEESANNGNKYTLLENKIEFGHELAIVLSKSVEGLRKYYPSKNYEVVLDTVSFKEVILFLEKLNITYQDIILIQKIPFIDFTLFDEFLKYYDYRPQLILEFASRIEQNKKKGKLLDKIKEEIDHASSTYTLQALDEICLGKKVEEIKEYANSKNIKIIYKKI